MAESSWTVFLLGSSDLTVQEGDALTFQVASVEKDAEAPGPGLEAAEEAEGPSTEHHKAEPESIDETTETEQAKSNNTSTDSKATRDPLRWFGILVPSALRTAQSSFVSAVDGAIPELATLGDSLRKQEIAIQRLRKQIRKS
jgi:hypothetical protein